MNGLYFLFLLIIILILIICLIINECMCYSRIKGGALDEEKAAGYDLINDINYTGDILNKIEKEILLNKKTDMYEKEVNSLDEKAHIAQIMHDNIGSKFINYKTNKEISIDGDAINNLPKGYIIDNHGKRIYSYGY